MLDVERSFQLSRNISTLLFARFGVAPDDDGLRRLPRLGDPRAIAAERATVKRAELERKAIADAEKIVAIWNARQAGGRALWLYPTIGAAIAAGLPWLTFTCPACGQYGSVDLRTLDRHPAASISSLIPWVSCRRCSPNAPFAKLEMLTAERP
jgi:hypothetical protein